MFKKRPRLPKIAVFVLVLIVIILGGFGWNSLTLAQGSTSQLEYRISRLESQVSQLSGQIGNLRNQGSGATVIQVEPGAELPRPSDGNRLLSGDPMFDRLSILVIETKQDVQELQKQLAKLEEELRIKN